MSSFTEAVVSRTASGRWRVAEPFVYHVGGYPSPVRPPWVVEVEAGFETDLVTLPRSFRWAIDRDALATAAVVHDWLLSVEGLDRVIADAVFHEAARATPNVSRATADAAFLAVLAWGWARGWRAARGDRRRLRLPPSSGPPMRALLNVLDKITPAAWLLGLVLIVAVLLTFVSQTAALYAGILFGVGILLALLRWLLRWLLGVGPEGR